MESLFYESLLKHFIQVAWKVAPDIARDENRCREVLHDRVFNSLNISGWEDAESKIRGLSKEFATPKAYANYLFTIFKNALIDELRVQGRAKSRDISIESRLDGDEATDESGNNEQFLGLIEKAEFQELPEKLQEIAERIFSELGREKRRLLSLRVIEDRKLEECAKVLGISKSSVDRHVKAVFSDLEGLLAEEGNELSENGMKQLISLLLHQIDQEKSND